MPLIGPPARARVVALARGSGTDDGTVNAVLSFDTLHARVPQEDGNPAS